MPPAGAPQTPENLHPNPPPPKHRARVMPRRKIPQNLTENSSTVSPPVLESGAMGPPPLPAQALQPDKFREDKLQEMMEDTDLEVRRKGREALTKKFQEHLPKVLAASQRFQTMLDIQNPTEWPLPTVREDISEGSFLPDPNVEILHTALDDCKDFAVPMDRSSDKGEFLDELHVKLHKHNVGIGGSSFSANAYPTRDTQASAAVSSATQLLRTATANAALNHIQATSRDNTKIETLSNDDEMTHSTLRPQANYHHKEFSLTPGIGQSSPRADHVPDLQQTPNSVTAEPATPPEMYWRGRNPDYTGTSVDAFSKGNGRKITRPLSTSLTEPDPLLTAPSDPVSGDITASQIACQRHEHYDANCLGCTHDAMHGLTTAGEEVDSVAVTDASTERTGSPEINESEGEPSASNLDRETMSGSPLGSGGTVSVLESADNSPFTGVALSPGMIDEDLVGSPTGAAQSTDGGTSEVAPNIDLTAGAITPIRGPLPDTADLINPDFPSPSSSMAHENSQFRQARTILPILQKSSQANAAPLPKISPATLGQVDKNTTTTAIVDPSIDQIEYKNKGKANSMGTEPLQQRVNVPAPDNLKGLDAIGSVKKSRNPRVPDPTHPGLKDTLTERMLCWDGFGSKACLTLTLEDTTMEITSPRTPQIVLLHHFEVGLDGVEAICRGQFDVLQTSEVKADRDARLGTLGTRKKGDGGMSGALKHTQWDSWYGQGIWVYYGIRFKQTRMEKKLKKGGKWICLGAPYDATSQDQIPARQQTQMVSVGGGKDRDGNDAEKFRACVQRTRMIMSKGGVGPVDAWTSSGAWADEANLVSATKKDMANNALRVTFVFDDELSLFSNIKSFVAKGPMAKIEGVSTAGHKTDIANVP